MATGKMLLKKDGAIGRLIFNNPDKHNAVSLEMWGAAARMLDEFQQDDTVRVVVVSGTGGKAFVSGADISQFADQRSSSATIAAVSLSWASSAAWINSLRAGFSGGETGGSACCSGAGEAATSFGEAGGALSVDGDDTAGAARSADPGTSAATAPGAGCVAAGGEFSGAGVSAGVVAGCSVPVSVPSAS